MKRILIAVFALACIIVIAGTAYYFRNKTIENGYWVIDLPTPNIGEGTNKVKGIILHHTAGETIADDLWTLSSPSSKVSAHALIGKDGKRYILAKPTQITWHAGYSTLNGEDWCNNFTVGIEFNGNTVEEPLTDDQIKSAIDYILPIMKEYNIKKEDIVTHEFVRKEWNRKHPDNQQVEKVDITPKEHARFMKELEKAISR